MMAIDRRELAFRMLCASLSMPMPAETTADEALALCDLARAGTSEILLRQADAAVAYFADEAASQPREGVANLPFALSGHWNTVAGRDMACATLADPHMAHNRARQPDMQLANEVFLSPGIGNLTAAKERIRWLSARLAVLMTAPTDQAQRGELG